MVRVGARPSARAGIRRPDAPVAMTAPPAASRVRRLIRAWVIEQIHRTWCRSFDPLRREATEGETSVAANTSNIRQAKCAINRAHGFVMATVAGLSGLSGIDLDAQCGLSKLPFAASAKCKVRMGSGKRAPRPLVRREAQCSLSSFVFFFAENYPALFIGIEHHLHILACARRDLSQFWPLERKRLASYF